MNQQWRRNHDVTHSVPGPRLVQQPMAYSAISPGFRTSNRVADPRHAMALASQVQASEVEINRLHQQLAAQQTAAIAYQNEITRLQGHLQQVNANLSAQRELPRRLEQAMKERSEAERLALDREEQVKRLQMELRNVATAAHAEQEQLAQQSLQQVRRHHAIVKEKNKTLSQLQEQFDRYRSHAAEAALEHESELQSLEATIMLLQTDHETVELTCADLDHHVSRLECAFDDVQAEIESLHTDFDFRHQGTLLSLELVEEQLNDAHRRLAVETEEKSSLIESLAALKKEIRGHDAASFAKDQEIEATAKISSETHRQLETLRREHQAVLSQNDLMRNQIRESLASNERLDAELHRSAEERDALVSQLDESRRTLTELQSTSRGADANMQLRLSEMEHCFVTERDAWESERIELENDRERLTAEVKRLEDSMSVLIQERGVSELPSERQAVVIAELEDGLAQANQSLRESISENERLQQTIESLHEKWIESTQTTAHSAGLAKECERLSRKLAEQTASHSRERDALKLRVEELHRKNELLQGDQEQLEINLQLLGQDEQELHQPTENGKAA